MPGGAIHFFFAAGLLMKRGACLHASMAEVSSLWSPEPTACPSKAASLQSSPGAVGKPACLILSKGAELLVPPRSCSMLCDEGWASRVWWEELGKASKLPKGKIGTWPVLFLKMVTGGGKGGKKGFHYICQIPLGSLFWGEHGHGTS